ncbi:MAG: replication-associated recombination protein A [Desulfatibacillaceae bacterium]
MRPATLDGFAGQEHVVGPGGLVRRFVQSDRIFSMIFWGPPGCGKTTLARIMAGETESVFEQLSAVGAGVARIREVVQKARDALTYHQRRTILFIDEIHRFNKAQQDALLPHVENGTVTLVGATTENPSFEVIAPLLSRCRVVVLQPLEKADLLVIMDGAMDDAERGLGSLGVDLGDDARDLLARACGGDARVMLNTLEIAAFLARDGDGSITAETAAQALQKKGLFYDKSGEEHYNLISAFHKSLRGSDPDAAVYWMCRMLDAGEDPLYLARRMVYFAAEDVGLADPHALVIARTAMDSYRLLGSPDGELPLYQAALYLATAPKSNAVYKAYKAVKALVEKTGSPPVPLHIRNAPTGLMAHLGYGREYRYPHDHPDAYVPENYFPEEIGQHTFYEPNERGFERTLRKRIDYWRERKNRKE